MPSADNEKRIKLIDMISETEDAISIPQEWSWLMTPYLLAFEMPSSVVVSEDLYVNVEKGESKLIYPQNLVSIVGSLDGEEENIKRTLDCCSPSSRAIVLLGNPGVGKTTCIHYYFSRPKIAAANELVYIDGRDLCSPIVELPPHEYLKEKIRVGIIKGIQRACRRLGIMHKINDIDLVEVDYTPKVERLIHSAASECIEHGIQIWLIIDNIDRRERKLQEQAIDYAKNVYTHLGIRSIIPIRPYTLQGRRLDDLQHVVLQPPSLKSLLHKRAEYAIKSEAAKEIVNQLEKGVSINLSWTNGIIDSKDKLLALYKSVGTALSEESGEFVQLLSAIHAHDLHYILPELKDICNSGYFCKTIVRRLAGKKRSAEELISAYMRGNYHHHRAMYQSGEKILNLFESGPDKKHRFISIRILQLADRYVNIDSDGIPAKLLIDKLVDFGFSEEYTSIAMERLVRCRLLIETTRFADWDANDFLLDPSDNISISFSGKYYLNYLLKNTHYFQCMAHVTQLPPSTIEKMSIYTGNAEDIFQNIFFLLEDVGKAVIENLECMRKDHTLVKFIQEINHQPGFFYLASNKCLKQVRRFYYKGILSGDVLDNFQLLGQMAQRISDIKTRIGG